MNYTNHNEKQPWGMETNTFNMLMHLSQLAGFIVPFAGLVLPIVMWATNKDEHPLVDAHGKNILNWMISAFLYAIGCAILTFFFIGILGFIALGILSLVFIITGAVKASNGEVYSYPLSIKFIN